MRLYFMNFADKETAIEVGQNLIDRHFGNQVNQDQVFRADDTLYQLLEDSDTNALNTGTTTQCTPRSGKHMCHNPVHSKTR